MTLFTEGPEWRIDGADWPWRECSGFVEVGDYRWHVQRMGEGPPAVLIHGSGASTHSWADLFPILAAKYEVVAFDLPGHGFTSARRRTPPTLRHVASQIGELLAALKVSPSLVVGHSAGAAIMLAMIRDRAVDPDAGVGVNAALSPFSGAAGLVFPAIARTLYYAPFTAYLFAQGARHRSRIDQLILGTGSKISQDGVDRYATLLRKPGHIRGVLGMMAHWDLSEMDAILAAIETPLLFVSGDEDRAVDPMEADRAARVAKLGQAAVLPGLGHLAHEEAPAAVADLILRFAGGQRLARGQMQ